MIPILIPSYEPDERLLVLLQDLITEINTPIIIINDGSSKKYDEIFDKANNILKACIGGGILKHSINKGKGAALKTGFQYIIENFPDAEGVVTADSDGQHNAQSISTIITELKADSNSLILGCRDFNDSSVPVKSRFGNKLTSKLLSFISGVHISDTQTGLRGIPLSFMKELLDVKGERFEFETRMLLESFGKYSIKEVPIKTIYDSKTNHQTHFNPIIDSIKIYKILGFRFFVYILSSFSSSLLDLFIFVLLCNVIPNDNSKFYVIFSTALARIASSIYNYCVNYKIVFKSKKRVHTALAKYYTLALFQMFASAILTFAGVRILTTISEMYIKIPVDIFLFFISYYIQRKYIF